MGRDKLKYLAALLLYGSNGVVAEWIDLSSGEIVYLRSVIGSALLLALFFLTGNRPTFYRYRRDALFILLSGAAMAADWLFLFEAYARIGVSLGMLINYSGPALVMALAPAVLHERLSGRKLVGLAAALCGVILISGQAASAGLNLPGLACAVLSAVAYALMVLLNKCARQVQGTENATLQLLGATAVVIVYTAFRQGLTVEIPQGSLLPVLWLGLVNTGLGCYCYFSALPTLPAQTVAVWGYLEPLSAVLFSAVLLGERLSPLQWLGAGLILGGALFGEGALRRTGVKKAQKE